MAVLFPNQTFNYDSTMLMRLFINLFKSLRYTFNYVIYSINKKKNKKRESTRYNRMKSQNIIDFILYVLTYRMLFFL